MTIPRRDKKIFRLSLRGNVSVLGDVFEFSTVTSRVPSSLAPIPIYWNIAVELELKKHGLRAASIDVAAADRKAATRKSHELPARGSLRSLPRNVGTDAGLGLKLHWPSGWLSPSGRERLAILTFAADRADRPSAATKIEGRRARARCRICRQC